ncbi:mechanosensitive Ion Channel (MscS2) [Vairimorpha necatrix]|uniref:Mechanosensitive Ion Channel (MscS2) n=1 Tax=Vairimorpha necatrix TaxID=6039 RepID=A0AAX4JEB9_9MICR
MILEERKKKILTRLNKTLKNTVNILENINEKIEETVKFNKEFIRMTNMFTESLSLFGESLFGLPIKQSFSLKKLIPNALLLTTLYKNSVLNKSLLENICKSAIVLSTSPLEKNKKMCLDKYEGILRDYNFWYLTLVKKNSVIYIPTYKVYEMSIEIFN